MNRTPLRLLFATVITLAPYITCDLRAASYDEPYRPQFHFTPERNWMNDPNGLVFFDGEYHLFYQHNPFGDRWGHMSWGHAVSRDLVHWQHLPLALAEENGVMIFSGSAIVDWQNTSGFGRAGRPPLVAIYTGHYTEKRLQNQHIAFSNDRGRTWTKYAGNPVLDIGAKDFRDPKVFWHEPIRRWVMVVSLPTERKLRFYASPNLKEWTLLGEFGPAGAVKGIWECPDLFPVREEGNPRQTRWVLIVNIGSAAPAGGSGCQYFIGDFDGKTFRPATDATPRASIVGSSEPALWADYGRDFYAAVSWSGSPRLDDRRLWMGWMSNWEYAQDVPTAPWRSAMSLPRELSLRRTPDGLRLIQQPVRELRRLRGHRQSLQRTSLGEANAWLERAEINAELWEIDLVFETPADAGHFGLKLHTSADHYISVGCDLTQHRAYVDRVHSGRTDFHPKFAAVHEAPLRRKDGAVQLHLWVDRSSVEVFLNGGEAVISDLFFAEGGTRRFELFSQTDADSVRVRRLEFWELKSAWR